MQRILVSSIGRLFQLPKTTMTPTTAREIEILLLKVKPECRGQFCWLLLYGGSLCLGCLPLHVPPRSVSSPTPLPLSTPTFGWLLCPPIKRRPSKAKGPPISLLVFVHQLTTKATIRRPPARSSPVASPLRCPPYCFH